LIAAILLVALHGAIVEGVQCKSASRVVDARRWSRSSVETFGRNSRAEMHLVTDIGTQRSRLDFGHVLAILGEVIWVVAFLFRGAEFVFPSHMIKVSGSFELIADPLAATDIAVSSIQSAKADKGDDDEDRYSNAGVVQEAV